MWRQQEQSKQLKSIKFRDAVLSSVYPRKNLIKAVALLENKSQGEHAGHMAPRQGSADDKAALSLNTLQFSIFEVGIPVPSDLLTECFYISDEIKVCHGFKQVMGMKEGACCGEPGVTYC